jgi:rhodanese-related sulfurtransferase
MGKNFIILSFIALTLISCSPKDNNVIFTGIIENVSENNILVETKDDVSFVSASVSYDKSMNLDFIPEVGQTVKIEILPEIMESYPVQVKAVKIELINSDNSLKAEYKKINAEEAKKIMDSESIIVLDVRTQSEYDEGHINNALLLPVTEIEEKAEEILKNKNEKILVYCRSGNRSQTASKQLIEMGYTEVYDFGGIIDWPYEIVK